MIENYSVNPNLKKNVVTTIDGSKEYRANCRMWKGQYFIKEKDCFEIDGTWYRLSSGLIIKDYETNKMLLKRDATGLVNGIVDYIDETPVMGYFTPNLAKNTIVQNSRQYKLHCISDEVAIKGGNAENIADGQFYNQELLKPKEKSKEKKGDVDWLGRIVEDLNEEPDIPVNNGERDNGIRFIAGGRRGGRVNDVAVEVPDRRNPIREVEKPQRGEGAGNVLGSPKSYGELTQYGVEDDQAKFSKTIEVYNNYPISYSKEVKRYARFLEGRTFGIEYETRQGFVPQRILSRCGLIPLRDGSLHGGVELSSIPLQGAKGLQTTSLTCNELSKRCDVSKDCSLHIHFGTLNENRLFTVALYQLGRRIQEELLQMFPYYKTDHTGIKEKNYCQKLRPLTTKLMPKKIDKESFTKYVDYYYTRIMTFLLEGAAPDRNYNHDNAVHPVQQKWNRTSRYYWMNFLPLLCSPRRTVEFRFECRSLN